MRRYLDPAAVLMDRTFAALDGKRRPEPHWRTIQELAKERQMEDPDYRQMEELQQERMERTMEVLTRVSLGMTNYDDSRFLAAELGIGHLWPRFKEDYK